MVCVYASSIALTGHWAAQAPQSTQRSAEISHLSPTLLIASHGQTPMQFSHPIQSLLILWAIVIFSFFGLIQLYARKKILSTVFQHIVTPCVQTIFFLTMSAQPSHRSTNNAKTPVTDKLTLETVCKKRIRCLKTRQKRCRACLLLYRKRTYTPQKFKPAWKGLVVDLPKMLKGLTQRQPFCWFYSCEEVCVSPESKNTSACGSVGCLPKICSNSAKVAFWS